MRLATLLASSFAAFALIIGSGFAVTQAHQPDGPALDVVSVASSIRTLWSESGRVDGTSMNVEVSSGAVTLSGSALSEAEAMVAEDLAMRAHGVSIVNNRLLIQP